MSTVNLRECVDRELDKIVERRTNAQLEGVTKEKIKQGSDGLVGLALSGGGVRSAAFNLGLLQALRKRKRFREVDYLSTVSGGGYVGSYVSSIAADPVTKEKKPDPLLDLKSDGRQPEGIGGLIDRTRYLNRILPWLNRQLIGFLLINVVVVSGLVCGASYLAWAFRSLDEPTIRDVPSALGFSDDISQAFFFSFVLFLGWLLAWTVAYLIRGARATGKVAHVLALLVIVSICLGVAALAGNGDVSLTGWHQSAGLTRQADEKTTQLSDYVGKALIGALIAMLVPYLNPKALITSATQPRNAAQRWIYAAASRALIFGVPLLVFYAFAKENISGQQSVLSDRHRYNEFISHETPEHTPARNRAAQHLTQAEIPNWTGFWHQVEVDSVNDPETTDDLTSNLAIRLLDAKDLCLDEFDAALRLDAARHEFYREHPPLMRWLLAAACAIGGERDNDFYEQLDRREKFRSAADAVAARVNEVIDDPKLFKDWTAGVYKERVTGIDKYQLLDDLRALDHFRQAQTRPDLEAAAKWQIALLNRRMLSNLYAAQIAPATTIFSYRVLAADQQTRLEWAKWAGVIFLISLIFVNLNGTSLHHWYRDALRHAWLWREGDNNRDIQLDQLKATAQGLPYHLISATVNLSWAQLGEPIQTDTFILSPEFCGSELTGYESTTQFSGGDYDLATAMAVSGAAISPTQIYDPLTALILTLSNSRLGQWVINPGRKRWLPATMRDTSFGRSFCQLADRLWISSGMVALDWIFLRPFQHPKDRRFCMLSDGGYSENLGVEQLLLRRCRLIIASDASYDPDYGFSGFDQLQTRVAAKYGIRLHAVDNDDLPVSLDALMPRRIKRLGAGHMVIARIVYPDDANHPVQANDATGYLIYLKPSFTGDEGRLMRYRQESGSFPFDPTYDQLFDEQKFIAYIELGQHIGAAMCKEFEQLQLEQLKHFNTATAERYVELVKQAEQANAAELEKKPRKTADEPKPAAPPAEMPAPGAPDKVVEPAAVFATSEGGSPFDDAHWLDDVVKEKSEAHKKSRRLAPQLFDVIKEALDETDGQPPQKRAAFIQSVLARAFTARRPDDKPPEPEKRDEA